MTPIALTIRFLLEIGALAAIAAWSAHIAADPWRPIVAIVLTVAFVVVWALVAAPKASNPLSPMTRELVGTGLLLLAAAGLALTGRTELGAAFALAIAIDQAVLLALPRHAVVAVGATAG